LGPCTSTWVLLHTHGCCTTARSACCVDCCCPADLVLRMQCLMTPGGLVLYWDVRAPLATTLGCPVAPAVFIWTFRVGASRERLLLSCALSPGSPRLHGQAQEWLGVACRHLVRFSTQETYPYQQTRCTDHTCWQGRRQQSLSSMQVQHRIWQVTHVTSVF
jgi:hypothetical protein